MSQRRFGFWDFTYQEQEKKQVESGEAVLYTNTAIQNYFDIPDGNIIGQLSVGKVLVLEEKTIQKGSLTEEWVRIDLGWIRKKYLREV